MNNNVWALTIVTSSTQPSVHSQLVFVTFWVSLGKFMSRLLFSCCSVSSVSSWTARRSSDCRLFTTEPEVYKKEWAVSFIGRTRGHRALIQDDRTEAVRWNTRCSCMTWRRRWRGRRRDETRDDHTHNQHQHKHSHHFSPDSLRGKHQTCTTGVVQVLSEYYFTTIFQWQLLLRFRLLI